MIKVLIADDHAIVREGLKQLLSAAGDMEVTGEAGDGQEVLELIRDHDYDVIVLDMTMPGISGIDLIKRIRQKRPDLRVLVLSMHKEDQFAIRSLKAGAAGYLTKGTTPDILLSAIRRVADGGRHISRNLAEKLAFEMDPFEDKPLHELLSDREYQVLCLLASGKNINDIADKLSLSANTVSTHKHRLMRKLNIDNNAELIRYALSRDLVQ